MFGSRNKTQIMEKLTTLVVSSRNIECGGGVDSSSYPESGHDVYSIRDSGKFLFAIDMTAGNVLVGSHPNQETHHIGKRKCKYLLDVAEYIAEKEADNKKRERNKAAREMAEMQNAARLAKNQRARYLRTQVGLLTRCGRGK